MSRTALTLATAACASLLTLLGSHALSTAHAQDGAASRTILCKTFKHPLDGSVRVDTGDRTSEVGQWVAEESAGGWTVLDVDFEVSQKQSGFPQGYVQVCLTADRCRLAARQPPRRRRGEASVEKHREDRCAHLGSMSG